MFRVPLEFLNTDRKASAAVVPKQAVRQVRQACLCVVRPALPHTSHRVVLYACLCTRELLHIGTHVLMVNALTPSSCACAQVSNAHGWHGARGVRIARANEQQKQLQKQKQLQQQQQQQQQKQQKQQKQKQKQKQKQQKQTNETRVSSLSPDLDPGAISVDGVEARIPAFAVR